MVPLISIALFAMLVIGADTGTLPPILEYLGNLPLGDKIGHVLVMGLVTLAVLSAILRRSQDHRIFTALGAVVLLIGLFTVEEFSQKFNPLRTFCFADLACSYGGVLWGTVIAFARLRQKQNVNEVISWR